MNEEEKKAIEYLKTRLYGNEGCKYIDVAQEDLRIFINLVDRKEKDIEGWKKYCEEIEKEQTEMSNKNCELEFEVEKLQKENEELKDIDLTTVHIKGVCDEKDRWRNKIRELILNKKQKIQENSKEIEECRKTIMEEQELKKLKLYTLHKNNDLLELEIADLFNLLKEE